MTTLDINAIETAILSRLVNDSTTSGYCNGNIMLNIAVNVPPTPYLLVSLQNARNNLTLGGMSTVVDCTIQLKAIGYGDNVATETGNLVNAATSAMQTITNITGYTVMKCILNKFDSYDDHLGYHNKNVEMILQLYRNI